MKMNPAETNLVPSTYAMIVRAEERPRNTFELLVYVALIASTFFAISQVGEQRVTLPFATERSHTAAATAG